MTTFIRNSQILVPPTNKTKNYSRVMIHHLWVFLYFRGDRKLHFGHIDSVQSFSHIQLFATPWTAAHQASLSITNFWSLFKLMSTELVMPSNYVILFTPFSSCLQSFPALGCFPMSRFKSGGQIIGASASASVLPINIQDWFPLGLTGFISLLPKRLPRIFSNTTIQKHQYFSA